MKTRLKLNDIYICYCNDINVFHSLKELALYIVHILRQNLLSFIRYIYVWTYMRSYRGVALAV
jgi:hypothetical protein